MEMLEIILKIFQNKILELFKYKRVKENFWISYKNPDALKVKTGN